MNNKSFPACTLCYSVAEDNISSIFFRIIFWSNTKMIINQTPAMTRDQLVALRPSPGAAFRGWHHRESPAVSTSCTELTHNHHWAKSKVFRHKAMKLHRTPAAEIMASHPIKARTLFACATPTMKAPKNIRKQTSVTNLENELATTCLPYSCVNELATMCLPYS